MGRMGRIGHEIQAWGLPRTFWAAEKVAAATAHEAAAAAHPPPTQRPPLGRSHSMGTTDPDGSLSHDHAVSGIGARVAHGEGAHLLEVKVGTDCVLLTRCEAARALRRPAGVAHTIFSTASKLECKRSEKEETPVETDVF